MDNQEISITFKNKIENINELNKYEERLKKINSTLGSINGGQQIVAQANKEMKSTISTTEKGTKAFEKMGKQINFAFNISAMTAYTKALSGFFTKLSQFTMKSTNYIENVNLLEVAYHNANETIEESSARIEDFIDKMSEVYGLDESDLARKLGIFKQLANAMQLPTKEAEHLSELMVKMTNDIASLYNLDLNRASNALQSALAGQVRPIRSATGADITEKTLQQTVDALSLDRTINELSFVEKRLIMVISLTNQLKNSQGDYARTIESASNQIRIMKEQFDRLSRAVGNVFYPILQGIMPYINGILMALTEIFNLIASLLGFKMPEFDYEGLSAVSDYAMDIEDGLNGASDSADKLNNKLKGLRGFDKLNVINTPTSSGSTSGGGAGGGIDPTIIDAFNKAFSEYDDKMNSVRMKAHDIRDSIMEWLGFTKLVNEETGKITWLYTGSNETIDKIVQAIKNAIPHLEKIWEYAKKIFTGVLTEFFKDLTSGPYGKLMETILSIVEGIFKTIADNEYLIKMIAKLFELKLLANFITNLGKVKTALGTNGIFGLVKKIYGTTTDLFKTIKNYPKKPLEGSNDLVKDGITLWGKQKGIINETTGKLNGLSGIVAGVKTALGGVAGTLTSWYMLNTAMEDIIENGANVANVLGTITSSIMMDASAFQTGTSIGLMFGEKWGKLGGEIGATLSVIEQAGDLGYKLWYNLSGQQFNDILEKGLEDYKKQIDAIDKVTDAIKNKLEQQDIEIEANKIWVDELGKIADENGKVKKGYEETAEVLLTKVNEAYGTHYKLVDGQITLNGEEEQSYKDIVKAIDEVIQKKKEQYLLEALQELVKQNQIDIIKLLGEERDLTDKLKEEQGYYNEAVKTGADVMGYSAKEWQKKIEQTEEKLDKVHDKQDKLNQDNQKYMQDIAKLTSDQEYQKRQVLQDYGLITKQEADKTKEVIKNASYDTKRWLQDVVDKASSMKAKIEIDANTNPFKEKLADAWNGLSNFKIEAGKVKIGKANGGVFANGQWHDVTAYGTGGLPPVGQMFVARERGPELVGTIGSHTAVMNNDQIVGSVSNGVYQAVRSAMGNQNQGTQVFNIYLDEEHKIGTYTLDQLQNMAKSNGKAITLG